jgi:MATE family multidrug resistance protein
MHYKLIAFNVLRASKRSFGIAVPLICYEMLGALIGIFITIMVSDLGNEYIAAHALVWSIYMPINLFFTSTLFATSILVSQNFGSEDNRNIRVCFIHGVFLALVLGPIMISLLWFAPTVLAWTGQDPAVLALATPSFQSLALAMLPLTIMTAIEHFFIGTDRAGVVAIMGLVACIIQISFFYLFLPVLGLKSAGYGLTISYCFLSMACVVYLFCSKEFKVYNLLKSWGKFRIKILSELVCLGAPIGFTFLIESGLFSIVAIMMGKLGKDVLASYHITYQYLLIATAILFGFTQATTIVIGIEAGKKDRMALRFAAVNNIIIAFLLMLTFSLCYIHFPEKAVDLYVRLTTTQEVKIGQEVYNFLAIVGVFILIESVRLISTGALRGLKDMRFTALINFMGFWLISLPIVYILGFEYGLGSVGIWLGILVGPAISGVILVFRLNRHSKYIDLETLVGIPKNPIKAAQKIVY